MTDTFLPLTERLSNPLEELRASVAARKGLAGALEMAILRLLDALVALLTALKEQAHAATAAPDAAGAPSDGPDGVRHGSTGRQENSGTGFIATAETVQECTGSHDRPGMHDRAGPSQRDSGYRSNSESPAGLSFLPLIRNP